MDFRVLHYFLTVAAEENFTRAAQALHLTQPTLSRQIAQLEQELGVQLFARSSRGISLTDDGLLFKQRAQEMLLLAEKARKDLAGRKTELAGELAVGSGEFGSTRVLAQMIAAFAAQNPKVRYTLHSGNADSIRDGIARGLLDVGLTAEPIDIRTHHFIPMPLREQWGAWIPVGCALSQKEMIRPEDLAGKVLISAAGEDVKARLDSWLGGYRSQVKVAASGNLLYNQLQLAAAGLGIVLGIQLDYCCESLRFIPLCPRLEVGTALVWRKDQLLAPAAAAFLAFARQYAERFGGKAQG